MPKRLLAVNMVLGGLCLLSIAFIVQQLMLTRPSAPAQRARAAPASPAEPPATAARPAQPAGAYATIPTRNLFSPTRTEDSSGSVVSAATAAGKPTLYGVVLRDTSSVAYLEDPATKRTAGYRIGDAVAGGTLQTISADQVVLASPGGEVKVLLRDPSKPRPAVPQTPPPGAGVRPSLRMPPRPGAAVQPLPQGAVTPPWTAPLPGLGPPVLPQQTTPFVAPGTRTPPRVGQPVVIPRGSGARQR